jgi:hypothetical protein
VMPGWLHAGDHRQNRLATGGRRLVSPAMSTELKDWWMRSS